MDIVGWWSSGWKPATPRGISLPQLAPGAWCIASTSATLASPRPPSNHRIIIKDCKDITQEDLDYAPIDLVFFDCHDYAAQLTAFEKLERWGLIAASATLVLHDTGLYDAKYVPHAIQTPDGWIHGIPERNLADTLMDHGWSPNSFSRPQGPMRNGLTILQRHGKFAK